VTRSTRETGPPPQRRAGALSRTSNSRPVLAKLWVYTEGERTEPDWLDHLKRSTHGVAVNVEVFPGAGKPKDIADKAVAQRELLTGGRRKDANTSRDEVWAVFDRDSHAGVDEAIRDCARAGVGVIFSSRCFELWPLLYYREVSDTPDAAELQLRLRNAHAGFHHERNPIVNWPLLVNDYPNARRRAIQLHQRASNTDEPAPSETTAWLLHERVKHAEDEAGGWMAELARDHDELRAIVERLAMPLRSKVIATLG